MRFGPVFGVQLGEFWQTNKTIGKPGKAGFQWRALALHGAAWDLGRFLE